MARLFINKDGRLKTGRVAILIFAGILVASAMLFKVNNSVDHALLAVRHVFEPREVQPIKEKPSVKQAIARLKSSKDKEVKQKKVQLQDKALTEEKKKADPVGSEKSEKTAGDHKMADTSPVKSETHIEKDPSPEELGRAYEKSASAEPPSKTDARIMFDQAALAKIARKSSGAGPEEEKAKTLNLSEKLRRLTAASKQPKEKEQSETPKAPGSLNKTSFLDADPRKNEVTVDQKQYKTLFHSWRVAGKQGKGKEKTPLRVENLRNTYDLFQMKPVAVIRGKAFFDLSDGTRVAEKSLEEYSTTVFLVDRPWEKWGKALSAAGIRRGDSFEVRYYMYDFIKNAIYARVNQAFSWCSNKGRIPGDLPAGAVDVLGRAYVINRQGGGRFGVFVPVSLDTRNGRTVVVDPACFSGQPDVETLREAGVL